MALMVTLAGMARVGHVLLVMYFFILAADIVLCPVIHFNIVFLLVECILVLRCYIIATVRTT